MKKSSLLAFFIISFTLTLSFWHCLPEPLFNTPHSSILLSRNSELLGAHIASDEQWRFPPSTHIPEKFRHSIITFEDKRFDKHLGIDPFAIIRALYQNLSQSRVVSGASTLSMQVIRLARKKNERTLLEKILEAFMALRLELRYSKDEILALYASHAPFGGNVVGLEAAAWRYFGRNPNQLSWAESTLLAVLPNSPALIHPGRNRKQLQQKRDRLLARLRQNGLLSDTDYQLAKAEPLVTKPHPLPRLAPHLLDTLRVQLPQNQQRFHSTLDKQLQQSLNTVSQHYAEQLRLADVHNLAVLVIDNHNFETRAYIANSPNIDAKQSQTQGYAIDLIQRPRSTGSTLKPFLFASMIQQGELLPETLIADTPVRYAGFMPKNYDRKYRGAIRAKQALSRSLNIPAVNMLSRHGVARFQAFLQHMGMSTLHRPAHEYGLSLIIGGAEGTLWELTALYANLAWLAQQQQAKALHYRQAILLKGQNSHSPRKAELSPATAWMTLQALLEVTRPGTSGYWRKFSSSRKIAWKTGTSYGHRDAWALGTTPRYTIGVWVGNAEGEGRSELTGTSVAAPLLFNVLNRLPQGAHQAWFKAPKRQMKTIRLCKDNGFLASKGCETIEYPVPKNNHFQQITPHHQRVHLDASEQWRVHSGCESPAQMHHRSYFILPPEQAYYYRQHHADYKDLPPYREDCLSAEKSITETQTAPFSLVYPTANTQIYIPRELDGTLGKTVFRAIHNNPEALLYWHLDKQFLGTTQVFHQQALSISAGKHELVLIGEQGQHIVQPFEVIERQD